MLKKTVLLTSVGVETGPNVISALRQSERFECQIIGVDCSRLAAGLYLCDQHFIVPRVDEPEYISILLSIASRAGVEIIIPLLSKEISVISANRSLFDQVQIKMALSNQETLDICEHKSRFVEHLHRHQIPAPRLLVEDELTDEHFPVFVKPIKGSSSRHAGVAHDFHDLAYYKRRASELSIQQWLEGPEYTIDTICDLTGNLIAGVVRERLVVKDGKAVQAKTVKNDQLMAEVRRLLETIQVVGPANLQCIEHQGVHKFFEINPRFSAGGLPLSTKAGINFPEILVRLLSGETIDPNEFNYQDNVYMSRHLTEVFPEIS